MPNHFAVDITGDDFSIELCVQSGQVFRWRLLDDRRWFGVDGKHGYLVSPRYEVVSNAPEEAFRGLFRLDVDFADIEEQIIDKAPEITPYLGSLRGLRLMKPSDATESFFSFLCTPNNNIKRITGMVSTLAGYGPVIDDVEGFEVRWFPRVDRIASIPEGELRAKGFGYRAATIPEIARQVMDRGGDDWILSLRGRPYQEAITTLLTIKGIGPKLADCIALFALHHTEAVPVDTHVWQAATRLYFPEWKEKAVTTQRYRAVGDLMRSKLGSLAAYAQQFLFFENVLNWRKR